METVTTQQLLTAGFLGLDRRFLADLKPHRTSLCLFCRAGVPGLSWVRGRGHRHSYYWRRVLQVVLQDPCPALCCWSLCNSALGKSFLVMHFSCNVSLCPQEKQDRVRRAVMKLIRSCLSSSFWLRRSGRDARYLSCFAAGMQCLSALALCSFGRLIQVHESV